VLLELFVQGSTAEILLNFCATNPPYRQTQKPLGYEKTQINDYKHGKLKNGRSLPKSFDYMNSYFHTLK